MVTEERQAEYDEVLRIVAAWSAAQPDIVGVAVVGSWARGAARMDSDIDLVVLSTDPDRYIGREEWIAKAVGELGEIVRTRQWGALTERRVRLASDLEVEFGFTEPCWAALDPVDPGSAGVVRAGCVPLLDEHSLFRGLADAVGSTPHRACQQWAKSPRREVP